jgi:hypothetical protein
MKRIRFTEEQIIAILREHEAGAKAADLALPTVRRYRSRRPPQSAPAVWLPAAVHSVAAGGRAIRGQRFCCWAERPTPSLHPTTLYASLQNEPKFFFLNNDAGEGRVACGWRRSLGEAEFNFAK